MCGESSSDVSIGWLCRVVAVDTASTQLRGLKTITCWQNVSAVRGVLLVSIAVCCALLATML
jgi:hypothetical protein